MALHPYAFVFLGSSPAIDGTPEKIGGVLAVVLLFLGVLKCAAIMRRKTTSTLCVCGLLLFLIGWLGSTVVSLSIKLFHAPEFLMALWSPIFMLLDLAALVVAIIGLAQYDRSKYTQGRNQAIWTIVLFSIVLTVVFVAFVVGLSRGLQKNHIAEANAPELGSKFNCSVKAPEGWRSVDPNSLGTKISPVAYRRFSPEMYMILIPETSTDLNLSSYVDVMKKTIKNAGEIAIETDEEASAGGLSFRRVTAGGQPKGMNLSLYYENWLTTKGGYFWRIMVWGDDKHRSDVATEARKFAEAFRIQDPTRVAGVNGALTDVSHPEWGFDTHLAGTGWSDGKGELMANELVRFGAGRPFGAMVVAPLRFESEPPDLAALTRGLLSILNFEYPSEEVKRAAPIETPVGSGTELTMERSVDGEVYEYVLRVVRGEREAWLVAGWWTAVNGNRDAVVRGMDAIALRKPSGPMPALSAKEQKALSLVLNEAGLSYFTRKDHALAAAVFQTAYEHDKEDSTILLNTGDALWKSGKPQEALAAVSPDVKRFPKNIHLQTLYAKLVAINGDPDAGNRLFLKLIEDGLKDEAVLLEWLNELDDLNRQDLGEQSASAWNAAHPSVKSRRWEAEVIMAAGDVKRAAASLQKLAEENPANDLIACELGETWNEAGQYEKAAAALKDALTHPDARSRALVALGWSQMGRKQFREAKASFEEAAKADPNDDSIAEAVRTASSELGQGDNSGIKQPLAAVKAPPELVKELERGGSPAFGEGEAAFMLLDTVGFEWTKGKPLRRTQHQRIKALNQKGVDSFSSLEFGFNPLDQQIFINHLDVEDDHGKKIAAASIDDAFVRDSDMTEANGNKTLKVPVPGLRRGYTVDVEVTIQNRSPDAEFPFTRRLMAHPLPCAVEAVFVVGDLSAVKRVVNHAGDLKTIEGGNSISWIARDLPALAAEPLVMMAEERLPAIWLGSGGATWADVAKKYLGQIADRLQPDATAVKKVAELCRGLHTDREKIAALAREVQQSVAYQAVEFGVRSRRPNSAADTLRTRQGDCKDHALLLYQLLRAAKIESYLALVQTDRLVQPDLPSLDQFNHMVVEVPTLGKGWLVDSTDKELALTQYPAQGFWKSHTLLLDSANPRLLPPVGRPQEGASIESQRSIAPAGRDWQVDETLTLSGYYAAFIREELAGASVGDQARVVQGILSDFGPVELKDFHFENFEEVDKPAHLVLSYLVRNAIKVTEGKAQAALPSIFERDYLNIDYVSKRRTPFHFDFPLSFKSTSKLKLPPGVDLQELKQHGGGSFANWTMTPGDGVDQLVNFEFRAKSGEWLAKDYAQFYEDWNSAKHAWDTSIAWKVN